MYYFNQFIFLDSYSHLMENSSIFIIAGAQFILMIAIISYFPKRLNIGLNFVQEDLHFSLSDLKRLILLPKVFVYTFIRFQQYFALNQAFSLSLTLLYQFLRILIITNQKRPILVGVCQVLLHQWQSKVSSLHIQLDAYYQRKFHIQKKEYIQFFIRFAAIKVSQAIFLDDCIFQLAVSLTLLFQLSLQTNLLPSHQSQPLLQDQQNQLLIYFMRISHAFLVLCLVLPLLSATHVLSHFTRDIARLKAHHNTGDTARAFSTLMKMLIHTRTLYQELHIPLPKASPSPPNTNCSQLLQQIVHKFHLPNWVELYQQIFPRLNHLAHICTSADFISLEPNPNGFDDKCALCSVLTRVMENYITYHRKDVAKFVEEEFCSMFDGLVKPTCEAFTHYAGPYIIKGILNKENSDVICHGSGMCKKPQCKILDKRPADEFEAAINKLYYKKMPYVPTVPSPWQWIIHLFTDHFGDKHLPPFDLDNDTFSDISTFRGYHWKGADCNEFDNKIYPGRKTGASQLDHDCNGIFGVDEKRKSLEEKYCANTTRLGVVVAGDSAGAHFSIPQKFFNVTMMQHGTFDDLLPRIADELDLPYESTYTAHTTTDYPSHSIYKKLRKLNLCNNNDYQNLGVNGGDSGNSKGNIKALKRDQQTDHPVLFFMQLIGNDVCGSNPYAMTNPKEFKENIIALLKYLDTRLPKGSHVVLLGLADGDILYQWLGGTIHPLDVTYDDVYNFLNCLKISPCAGWLNTDEEIRKNTTRRAKILTKIYREIIVESYQFKNFDYQYYDFPTEDIIKRTLLENRSPREMIERCDGFHPSGTFNSFLADWLWFRITQDHPEWIGEQNPYNQEIKKIFGLHDLE